jgi:hypothetical protein
MPMTGRVFYFIVNMSLATCFIIAVILLLRLFKPLPKRFVYPVYFDIDELAYILELQGKTEIADKLRAVGEADGLPVIAGKAYVDGAGLAKAGISVEIGWGYSSYTPVRFSLDKNRAD